MVKDLSNCDLGCKVQVNFAIGKLSLLLYLQGFPLGTL